MRTIVDQRASNRTSVVIVDESEEERERDIKSCQKNGLN